MTNFTRSQVDRGLVPRYSELMTTNTTHLKAERDRAWTEYQTACKYWHANKGKPGVSAQPHFDASQRYQEAERALRNAEFPEAAARAAARIAERRANTK